MQFYQFERIYSQMEKEFGKVRRGEEDMYSMLLFALESNALKIHRANPACNSRRFREAIALALFDIKMKYTGENIDTDKFRDQDNEKLEKALLMAFDPFTNEEVMQIFVEQYETEELGQEFLYQYYKIPVMCLLRIKESVDQWEKKAGADGYFNFLEGFMGKQITGNEMHYSIFSIERV